MDYVWELIQPYVAAVLAALGSGGIITLIVRSIVNKVLSKNNTLLDATYNTERVSRLVADKLAGKIMNIDVTAVTEKALGKTTKALDARVEKVEDATNSLKGILVAIAKGIVKLKALNDDERAELTSAVQQLENSYTPPEANEVLTVRLAPIELEEDSTDESDNGDSGVNFGGLDE